MMIGSLIQIKAVWNEKGFFFRTAALMVVCIVVFLNGIKIYNRCRLFWTKPVQEDEEIEFIQNSTDKNDCIQIVTPQYCGFYLVTGLNSASKYVYVQTNHFWNMREAPEKETAFWDEYIVSIKNKKPRMMILDREYTDKYEAVKELLTSQLNQYQFAGKSTRLEFYILPRYDGEKISEFHSKYQTFDMGKKEIQFSISQEMIEAYKRGEITIDDFMTAFDEATKVTH